MAIYRNAIVALQENSREGETIARVGGEEICVNLINCSQEKALMAAERFRLADTDAKVKLKDKDITVTASLGVASTQGNTENDLDAWKLHANADKTMYQAKSNGRNQVTIFSEE